MNFGPILAPVVALLAPAASAATDQQMEKMTALYEEVCLKAFPNDRAVEAAMRSRKARELTPEQVKVTMGNDPARGWELQDKSATVWLEFPPYHACSVRWNAAEIGDLGILGIYGLVASLYEAKRGGFAPMEETDLDYGDIHLHALGEQKRSPNGDWESLYVIDQHIIDPKRRAAGETGFVVRFVHQFKPAGSK